MGILAENMLVYLFRTCMSLGSASQTLPKTCRDIYSIGKIMSKKHAEENSPNPDCLKKILFSIRYIS